MSERLQRLLGGPHLRELRMRLRSRYERGIEAGVLTLTGLSEMERSVLAGLLGLRVRRAASMRIDIEDLDTALRNAGLAASMRDALEMLDGTIANRAAERVASNAQWDSVRAGCEARLAALLSDAKGLGLLKRLARGDPHTGAALCDAARSVLRRLPAAGIARSRLAAEALGDAHALDQGRAVATLVLSVLRQGSGGEMDEDAQPGESTRTVWAEAGVLVNELARPALFLNLPVCGGTVSGQPSYLSLRELLRAPPRWDVAGRTVFVCENPNLVAIAADALGARCAPLACTDGMPAAAQRSLLTQLAAAGAQLRYHGDFDWAGLRIGNWVMRRFKARPWRYEVQDYLAAIAEPVNGARSLATGQTEAGWDAELAATMQSHGRAVDEEAVADALLFDLADYVAKDSTKV
jgi:uncharacterized protein (TIGR02679 family)